MSQNEALALSIIVAFKSPHCLQQFSSFLAAIFENSFKLFHVTGSIAFMRVICSTKKRAIFFYNIITEKKLQHFYRMAIENV